MIVDGHAYCFPPLGDANGFPSVREHLRYVQREMADHHQPVWRLADRAPGDNAMLADPADRTLRGLREVGFRAGGHGRFVWTVEGHAVREAVPAALPRRPLALRRRCSSPRWTTRASTARCSTPTTSWAGSPTTSPDCVRRHPTRLLALAHLPEWEIERDPERGDGGGQPGLRPRAARLPVHRDEPVPARRHGVVGWSRAPRFWDHVARLGRPVFFTLTPWPRPTVDDYLGQLRTWQGWLERYPDGPRRPHPRLPVAAVRRGAPAPAARRAPRAVPRRRRRGSSSSSTSASATSGSTRTRSSTPRSPSWSTRSARSA